MGDFCSRLKFTFTEMENIMQLFNSRHGAGSILRSVKPSIMKIWIAKYSLFWEKIELSLFQGALKYKTVQYFKPKFYYLHVIYLSANVW